MSELSMSIDKFVVDAITKACQLKSTPKSKHQLVAYVIDALGVTEYRRGAVVKRYVYTVIYDLIEDGTIQEIGGRYRLGHIGGGTEEMPLVLPESESEAGIFERTDSSGMKPPAKRRPV